MYHYNEFTGSMQINIVIFVGYYKKKDKVYDYSSKNITSVNDGISTLCLKNGLFVQKKLSLTNSVFRGKTVKT